MNKSKIKKIKKIWLCDYYLDCFSFSPISKLFGLDKFLSNPQEVIFLMSGFLNNVEEGILHYDLCDFSEFLIQHQVLMIWVIPLLLHRLALLFFIGRILNFKRKLLSLAGLMSPEMRGDSCQFEQRDRFTRFICTWSGPRLRDRLLLTRWRYFPVRAFLTRQLLIRLSLSGSFTVFNTKKYLQDRLFFDSQKERFPCVW